MILTLSLACFLLGFSVAVVVSSKSKEARGDLEELFRGVLGAKGRRNLRNLSLESVEKGGKEQTLPDEGVQLLTKYDQRLNLPDKPTHLVAELSVSSLLLPPGNEKRTKT